MNKKLFLSSSFEDVADILFSFEENIKGKKVTFIPTASIVEEVVFFVDSGKKSLEKFGLIVDELELSTASAKEIELKITSSDIIYVTGGNTFFLLQEMKRTGADKLIINEINAGKLYIGESAGAVVTAPNIEYVRLMDNPEKAKNLENFNALGLVDFYTVPHYTDEPFKEYTKKIIDNYYSKLNLKPISNNQAILVNGNEIMIKSR
ncbi:peptidase E [Peptostreptococcus faecalis]|uniref:peptidase E n=1 Tax=Peptostreptococcus faecalis TaxID=2045015 RepID=UPI000C7CD3A7|nr:Type 1 glutamine amidotransferase-like domain-containing protein [Peptostreptococcus faecalis]